MQEFDLEIVFTPAMLGLKRKSDEVCSTNNLSRWWKQSKTRIMNKFKADMREWFISESEDNPYRWAEIHFTILRTNGRKMDPDSLGSSTYKWTIDLLTELGYIIDDDQCRVIQNPTQLHCKGNIETSVKMQVKFHERIEMSIDELKEAADQLVADLKKVDGTSHNKAASKRVRTLLMQLRGVAPGLCEDLIDLDKT